MKNRTAALAAKAEYYRYEQLVMAILGKKMRVRDVPAGNDAIGFTAKDEGIFVAYNHPVMDGLDENERRMFRRGVFIHELMHQVFTNFDVYDMRIRSYKASVRPIAADLCNIVEDPAIEYWAQTVIGGTWLKALEFTIAHIYKLSNNIDEAPNALSQFFNALINFGDMGLIKGRFTFPEARTCFLEASPIFYKAIKEPSCAKRMLYAHEIMEISKPLWEDVADFNELMEELAKNMESMHKSPMSGKGSGKNGDNSSIDPSSGDSKKEKRRKVTVKKISKEEAEAMKGNGSASSGELPDEGDVTVYVCDELDEDGNGSGSSISVPGGKGKKSDKSEGADGSCGSGDSDEDADGANEANFGSAGSSSEKDGDDEDSDVASGDSNGNKSDDDANSGDSDNGGKTDSSDGDGEQGGDAVVDNSNPFRTDITDEAQDLNRNDEFDESDSADYGITEEDYSLSEADIAAIQQEAENERKDYEKVASKIALDDSPIDNTPISSPIIGRKSCLNYRVTYGEGEAPRLEAAYNNVLNAYKMPIHAATSQLKRIFENDQEEKEYRTSGRVNPARANSGRVTSRVFDKRRLPADKSNLAVMLLVDESGSMYSDGKSVAARESCIGLAEIFGRLNIPTYVMGFTANTENHDVVHNHYLTWKNTHQDRLKLLNITARANNLDGYSIRYGKELMKKKDAVHKLVIVLSDGLPNAYGYSGKPADNDTKEAIKELKKVASVLGVAIGNSDTDAIRNMYETDFMHISNANDLFANLVGKIKILVRGW